MDDRDASDLYRVRKTLCQMLNDRKYVISDDDLHMTLDDFKGLFTGDGGKIACAPPPFHSPAAVHLATW